jgi:hypothetical protein
MAWKNVYSMVHRENPMVFFDDFSAPPVANAAPAATARTSAMARIFFINTPP